MSEYQYYEFQALDKPLTKQQQKELRSLSSRAEITATSFVNEYNYGDFRGEPQKLMERYFDAFCYLANWGTRRLMFRLPKTVLDAQTARRYCHSDAASVTETADHVIIDLCLERDPDDEWLEGSGLLAGMVQARSDLAAGDLRLLYLAWLLGIQRADQEDDDFEDETEPPVPADLGELSAPLEAIADFLEIYEDLLAVAAVLLLAVFGVTFAGSVQGRPAAGGTPPPSRPTSCARPGSSRTPCRPRSRSTGRCAAPSTLMDTWLTRRSGGGSAVS